MRTTFASLVNGFGRFLGLHDLSLDGYSEGASRRMRQQQMRGAIEQTRVFLIGNTVFAPVLSVQAWNMGMNGVVIAWTLCMVAFSWCLLARWRGRYQTSGTASDMRTFVRETQVNALLWCLGWILFFPLVTGDQKSVIITIMLGSFTLGSFGFAQVPRAAYWYLAIQTMALASVLFYLGVTRSSQPDLMLSGLAVIAAVALWSGIHERALSQTRAFRAVEELSQKSEVVDLLLKDYDDQGTEWLWRTDATGNIVNIPPLLVNLLAEGQGYLGQHILDALRSGVASSGRHILEKVDTAFGETVEFHDIVLPFAADELGNVRWIMMRGRPQFEGLRFTGFRGIFADATKSISAQKQVEFLARHDNLTGTYNRNTVQNHLVDLSAETDSATAYLIDLDGFKQVNDSYGHAIGDKLLQAVAGRLNSVVSDHDLVARLNGDEFLVIARGACKFDCWEEDALAERLLGILSDSFFIDHYDIALSASIGTASFPQDTTDGSMLLNLADLALYAAKRGGRNRCVAFIQSMQVGLQKRLLISDRLRLAVQNNDIRPFYQPQYCAKTGNLVGFEALARWFDAELGVVGPDIFIPIAEETGLILEIGSQLLNSACAEAKSWPANEDGRQPTVSVNVSPVQVTRGNLVDTIQNALFDTGLPPERLEIEVTEGVLIHDTNGTKRILDDLSELGVSIALDDFGTGYSSLSYIRALALDRLKIDRTFIKDINAPEAQSIVKTIIELCQRLDLTVIAEGVETSVDVALLKDMECHILQGYYFSRPVPASELPTLFNTNRSDAA